MDLAAWARECSRWRREIGVLCRDDCAGLCADLTADLDEGGRTRHEGAPDALGKAAELKLQ